MDDSVKCKLASTPPSTRRIHYLNIRYYKSWILNIRRRVHMVVIKESSMRHNCHSLTSAVICLRPNWLVMKVIFILKWWMLISSQELSRTKENQQETAPFKERINKGQHRSKNVFHVTCLIFVMWTTLIFLLSLVKFIPKSLN